MYTVQGALNLLIEQYLLLYHPATRALVKLTESPSNNRHFRTPFIAALLPLTLAVPTTGDLYGTGNAAPAY